MYDATVLWCRDQVGNQLTFRPIIDTRDIAEQVTSTDMRLYIVDINMLRRPTL